jgi:hypothetical protein
MFVSFDFLMLLVPANKAVTNMFRGTFGLDFVNSTGLLVIFIA